MKKPNFKALLFSLIFLVLSNNFSFAQEVAGKIYSKEEADKLFGPVLHSITMSASQFESLLSQSGDRMLFKFDGSDLYVLNSKRNVMFTTGLQRAFSVSEQMKVYSALVVKELLSKGQSPTVTIEKRESVMSVTDGAYTMENASACPPYCPLED